MFGEHLRPEDVVKNRSTHTPDDSALRSGKGSQEQRQGEATVEAVLRLRLIASCYTVPGGDPEESAKGRKLTRSE